MFGSRGIWHKGWKAVPSTVRSPGMGNFEKDRWQLFHTDEDRAEATTSPTENPDKVEEMNGALVGEAEATTCCRSTT